MNSDTEDVKHYEWLAPLLINGDATGISDLEEAVANKFLEDIRDVYGKSAEVVNAGDNPEFSRPEWGGLYGTVVDYTIRFNPSELPSDLWALEKDMSYLPRG